MRIGHGIDIHQFSTDSSREMRLGLVRIEEAPGLVGHSDADVVTHAVIDALFGGANLGDIGRHFPDTDPQFANIASRVMLIEALRRVTAAGFRPISADVTIVAERPKVAPYMSAMSEELSAVIGCVVSVKATTAEGLGALGRAEGIAATAVVLLEELS